MSKIAKNITELIGKTPLVQINKLAPKNGATVVAKLESWNPGGSVKDRPAYAMIEAAEKAGKIDSETVIVEPTSGNMGVGLALASAVKGYRLILTMPESLSIERRKLLKKFGAELVLTPAAGGMKAAIEKALEIAESHKKSFVPFQFKNHANSEAHYKNTAKEIWEDTDGKIDIFVAGVGSGGTITGVGKYLKEKNPDIKIIALEPEDSQVLAGGQPGPHKIQGIGAGFIPDILDKSVIDEIVAVSNDDAVQLSNEVASKEGILVGISSGAALWGAIEVAKRTENKDKLIVTVFPDTGERYLSIFEM